MVDTQTLRLRTKRRRGFRYLTKPTPIQFPVDVGLPETRRHYELRTALFQIAKLALADTASLGSDQCVYWNAANPSRCVSPDLFVRLCQPDSLFDSWKTWERGAPEVAVEILSDANATELGWEESLLRYQELGVEELVRFDPVAPTDSLRVWDRVDENLSERQLEDPAIAQSAVLGFYWVVTKDPVLGRMLRLAKDASGGRLLPTPVEYELKKRHLAEQRVQELEAQLRRKG